MGEAKRREEYLLETEGNNVVDLKIITGGGTPPNGDWLSNLEVGTMFLVQKKQGSEFVLGCFKLMEKTEKAAILLMQGSPEPIFVNPVRFCQMWSLYEVMTIPQEEEGEQDGHEHGDRTDAVESGGTEITLATDEGIPVKS